MRHLVRHLMRHLMRHHSKIIHSFLSILLGIAISGCTPTFDWRITRLTPQSQALTVEFPAKPATLQRTIALGDAPAVTMTLTAARINNAQFALGSVPAANAAQAEKLAMAMAQGFANNLNAPSWAAKPVVTPQATGAFAVTLALPKQAIAPKAIAVSTTAVGRFVWTNNAVYQLLAIIPAGEAGGAEEAEQFIRSFKFE